MVVVAISCPVCPSENQEKVRDAILNIFPDAVLERTERGFKGEATTGRFYDLVRKQKILDSTRSIMFKSIRGNSIVLNLNKQVASVGKISFTEPKTILGTLRISIDCDDPEAFIDDMAPRTVDGQEIRS